MAWPFGQRLALRLQQAIEGSQSAAPEHALPTNAQDTVRDLILSAYAEYDQAA